MTTTRIDEITDGIYRISTLVPGIGPDGFSFNQFLIDAEEPLLFHTGHRSMFASVTEAIATVLPLDRLRWIAFGHVESDECGSMNQFSLPPPERRSPTARSAARCHSTRWLTADRAHSPTARCSTSAASGYATSTPPMSPTAGRHGSSSIETTATLLCGDLLTHMGGGPALVETDLVGAASAAEDLFRATCLTPGTAPSIRRLAELAPRTLALMHGSSFTGGLHLT